MSPQLFEEIQLIGTRKVVRVTKARLFPEQLFVRDLVFSFTQMADEISENDYLTILTQ